jgi:uncharacterized membrane protein YgcG
MEEWGAEAETSLLAMSERFHSVRGSAAAFLAELQQKRQLLQKRRTAAAAAVAVAAAAERGGRNSEGAAARAAVAAAVAAWEPPHWAWRHSDASYFRAFLPPSLQAAARGCATARCYSVRAVEGALLVPLLPQGGSVGGGSSGDGGGGGGGGSGGGGGGGGGLAWDTAAAGAAVAAKVAATVRRYGTAVIGGGLTEPSDGAAAAAAATTTTGSPTLLAPPLLEALRLRLAGVALRAAKSAQASKAAAEARGGTVKTVNGIPVPTEMAPIRAPAYRRHHMLHLAEDFGRSPAEPAARALQLVARALLPVFARLTPPNGGANSGGDGGDGGGDGDGGGARGVRRLAVSELNLIEVLPGASSQSRHSDILPDVTSCAACDGNSSDTPGVASPAPSGEEADAAGGTPWECVCGRRTWSVFVPLVDVAHAGGATQVWPGSQRSLMNVDHAPSFELGSKKHPDEAEHGKHGDAYSGDGDGNSLVDHFDPLGVRLAVRAGRY